MIRNAQSFPWIPKGVSDTLDSTTAFQGSMAALTNLIPDPTTAGLWQCRSAATIEADMTVPGGSGPFSSGFSTGFQFTIFPGTPGQITAFKVIGNYIFGFVTNTAVQQDEPFAFNILTGSFLVITGVTAFNVPQSSPASGAWVPPTLDLIGSKLIFTHPGFSATGFFFGWLDLTNINAPAWNAGNLTGAIAFQTVPTFVAQFGQRAYYITNLPAQPAVVFTDVLNPLNCTNGNQALTFGDTVALTALGQLRLYNQSGGIIQALIVFKDEQNMFQITGDAAFGNLSVNAMNYATGTAAPNTLCATPKGLAFVSPEGLRIIDYQANISDPIGVDSKGVVSPFIFSAVPSRMCAACSGNIIRITSQNAAQGVAGAPQQEWWYDLSRQIWSGPHTCAAGLIQPFQGSFLLTLIGVNGKIFKSDIQQSAASVFTENGVALTWNYLTSFFPNNNMMGNYQISQSLLDFQFAGNQAITAIALTQDQSALGQVTISAPGAGAFWGGFLWGQANWGVPSTALAPRQLPWPKPLVFAKMQLRVFGNSVLGVRIGGARHRMRQLRYLQDVTAAA